MFCDEPKLKSEIKLNRKDFPDFSADSKWCGVGSCFSDNLLSLLEQCGFNISRNPSGIIYNSYSMMQVIQRAVGAEYYSGNDFFEYEGRWHSWEHHGKFSNKDLNAAVENANEVLSGFRAWLESADAIVLTPSSSVVYCLKENNLIVANCHKVKNSLFERKILSIKDNYEFLSTVVRKIAEFNSTCKIIFTLSPVRHYPGDLVLNSYSKANLLSALHEVCQENLDRCIYFPAYEILHDELRDYRFFKTDLMHPSEQAVELICGRFIKMFFCDEAIEIMDKKLAENKRRNHRLINET
jgi:hypothetical protein